VITIGTYTLAYEVTGTDTETKALIGQLLLQWHQVLGRLSNTHTTKGEVTHHSSSYVHNAKYVMSDRTLIAQPTIHSLTVTDT